MRLAVLKERRASETRVAAVPDTVTVLSLVTWSPEVMTGAFGVGVVGGVVVPPPLLPLPVFADVLSVAANAAPSLTLPV